MIQRLQESVKIRIKNLLNLLGVKRHQPRHFIILSSARVGSTLLHTYLNSHWNIMSYGEFLGKDHRAGHKPDINKFYQQPVTSQIRLTGCKVFYDYTRDTDFDESLEKLYSDPELFIIHLTREDAIASYLSLLEARATGEWTTQQPNHSISIEVDIEHMLNYLEQLTRDQLQITSLFASQNLIQSTYESLIEKPDAELRRIQDFLGVRQRKLRSVLKRQHSTEHWSSRVRNYTEVRKSLEGSPWAGLTS